MAYDIFQKENNIGAKGISLHQTKSLKSNNFHDFLFHKRYFSSNIFFQLDFGGYWHSVYPYACAAG